MRPLQQYANNLEINEGILSTIFDYIGKFFSWLSSTEYSIDSNFNVNSNDIKDDSHNDDNWVNFKLNNLNNIFKKYSKTNENINERLQRTKKNERPKDDNNDDDNIDDSKPKKSRQSHDSDDLNNSVAKVNIYDIFPQTAKLLKNSSNFVNVNNGLASMYLNSNKIPCILLTYCCVKKRYSLDPYFNIEDKLFENSNIGNNEPFVFIPFIEISSKISAKQSDEITKNIIMPKIIYLLKKFFMKFNYEITKNLNCIISLDNLSSDNLTKSFKKLYGEFNGKFNIKKCDISDINKNHILYQKLQNIYMLFYTTLKNINKSSDKEDKKQNESLYITRHIEDFINEDIINANVVNEDISENLFFLLDVWFGKNEIEQNIFTSIVIDCIAKKTYDKLYLVDLCTKNGFDVKPFVNFINDNIDPKQLDDDNKDYFYDFKKIVDAVISNKADTNKYTTKKKK